MDIIDQLQRRLMQATVGALFLALTLFLVTLVCAVLGLAQAVATLNGVTLAIAAVFGMLLAVFLLTSLVRAVVHFINQRSNVAG